MLYLAPKLIGDSGMGLFALPELTDLAQACKLKLVDVRAVGEDWRYHGEDRALMFAGIVTHVGRIESARAQGDGLRLRIAARDFALDEVRIGDSIALQGACHTVVARDAGAFEVDTSRATLDVTAGLEAGRDVNLEKSLRLADRIDGHLVSGHVDGVGRVVAFEDLGGSARLEIEAPAELARYIARKGSIAVDGVSLTVNARRGIALRGERHPPYARGDHPRAPCPGRAREPRSGPPGALRRAHHRGAVARASQRSTSPASRSPAPASLAGSKRAA